eukprot:13140243-Heterocapsa_arctica.AAC.1
MDPMWMSLITETVRQVEVNSSTVRNAIKHRRSGNTVIVIQLVGSIPARSGGSSHSPVTGTSA